MAKILCLLFPVLLVVISFIFKKRQNKGDIVGGDISTPKSLWLSFCIGGWFLFPFLFFLTPFEFELSAILHFHLISVWVRGVLEFFMIYKWYNWSPRYGIAHNTFHLLGVLILSAFHLDALVVNTDFLFFVVMVLVSFFFENLFAFMFFKVRGEEKHKVYFASDDPQWRVINRITIIADFLCYGLLGAVAYLIRI